MKFEFRQISIDETANWNLANSGLPADVRIYSTSFYRVGEATHCCSIIPSSWTEFLRNDFVYPAGVETPEAEDDPAKCFMDAHAYENGGESGAYIDYRWAHQLGGQSEVIVIDLDDADYEDTDEGREAMRTDAWDQAREELQANWRDSIPVQVAVAA